MKILEPCCFVFIKRPEKGVNGQSEVDNARKVMKRFSSYMDKRMIGIMCPEGTRNNDYENNRFLPFKKGFV